MPAEESSLQVFPNSSFFSSASFVKSRISTLQFLPLCTPCSSAASCSALFCSASCPSAKLHAASWHWPGGGLGNASNVALEVRATTVGGSSVTAASKTALVDRTAPEQSKDMLLMYFDPDSEKRDYEEVSVQVRTGDNF